MRWRLVGLAGLTLMLSAGCSSWHGDSSVTLADGTVHQCVWLGFSVGNVHCGKPYGGEAKFRWTVVAGYRAGIAR